MTQRQVAAPSLVHFVPMMILVAFTLRTPITSLATAVPQLRADLGISTAQAGLLTSLPIIMFAVTSAAVSAAARKWGANRVLLFATVVLGIAVAIRPWGGYGLIVATTMVVGAFIAAGNVLLPVIVRRDFPHRQGTMMALNTASITSGATLAAATTGVLITWWGWQLALAAWSGIMLLAFIALFNLHRRYPGADSAVVLPTGTNQTPFKPLKSLDVWVLGIYFALQSGLFYGSTAWLPSLLPDVAGMTTLEANQGASMFQLLGVLGALTAPLAVSKMHSWRLFAMAISAGYLIMSAGILLLPGASMLWTIIGGYGQGATFAILMALVTIRSANTAVVRSAGAAMQTIGYIGAALIPLLMGVFATDGNWTPSLLLLLGMSALLVTLAIVVGSPRRIGVTQA